MSKRIDSSGYDIVHSERRQGPSLQFVIMPSEPLGKRLRWLIVEHLNLRQAEFARRLGVHPSQLSRWLNNPELPPNEESLKRIVDVTGVSPAWLRYGTGEPFDRDRDEGPGHEETQERRVRLIEERYDPHLAEAEEWLSKIINPDLLRRHAGTPTGRDVILGIKSFLFDLDWPLETKNEVDALLNQIAADAKTSEH